MLVPIKWLKDFIDFNLSPSDLSEMLVNAGFEVESIINLSDKVKNVYTGKILNIEKHPKADKLKVLQVQLKDEVVQVITNSNTVRVGSIVPIAIDGATLTDGTQILNTIIKDVFSIGMLCGIEQIVSGAHSENNDVYIFDNTTPLGVDVNTVVGNDDVVLDISITSNRPDANSILGIAREIACILNKPLKKLTFESIEHSNNLSKKLDIVDKSNKKCLSYCANIIDDIIITESPEIIKNRLRSVGLRPINNIVDLTNYILIAIGQPMHAFDYDMIKDSKIIVRDANISDTITCLNNNSYALSNNDLVIADSSKPLAIAGIIGGSESAVSKETRTIVLESALFNKESVRKSSKRLGIRTDSSSKFEKGVDFTTQTLAIQMFLSYINRYNWGKTFNNYVGFSEILIQNKAVIFTLPDIKRILGIEIPQNKVISILESLNFSIEIIGDKISATPPNYRFDIFNINDIAEEIIRIYGYDNIITNNQAKFSVSVGGKSVKQINIDKIRNILISEGMFETMTYSFISPLELEKINVLVDSSTIKLFNPLGVDYSIMRSYIAPSMLNVMSKNYRRSNKAGKFFEISKTYEWESKGKSINENLKICIASYNCDDFYSFKNSLEKIFSALNYFVRFNEKTIPFLHPYISSEIICDRTKKSIGYVGKVKEDVCDSFELINNSYIAEIDIDFVLNEYYGYEKFNNISKYQPVERDFAIICNNKIKAQEIIDVVVSTIPDYLRSINIFDIYENDELGKNNKSVAFKVIIQSFEKSLSENDINNISKKILNALNLTLGAILR